MKKLPPYRPRVPGLTGRMFARQRHIVHPLDHDGDGQKGGSLPTRKYLIEEAEAIGAVFEKRWNRRQLAEAIAARKRYLGI